MAVYMKPPPNTVFCALYGVFIVYVEGTAQELVVSIEFADMLLVIWWGAAGVWQASLSSHF